jgi:arylsulfatase A-like enzyme
LFRNGKQVHLRNFVPGAKPNGTGVATVRNDYSPDRVADEAIAWLERNHSRPFFLFLASTLPHANNEAGPRGQETPSYDQYANRDWPDAQKGTAAMISRLDATVGQVREKLKQLGVADNTIVIFTSDNGPHAEGGNNPKFFRSAGPFRGIKRDLYEGGIRVPALAVWPGHITPGQASDALSGFQDWLPTFAELASASPPDDIDGVSLVPTLLSQGKQTPHDFLYWEFHEQGGKRAIRSDNWKAVQLGKRQSRKPCELYDLATDPGEEHNVAAVHPDMVAKLEQMMDAASP